MINFRDIEKIRAEYEAGHFGNENQSPKTVAYTIMTLLGAIDQYQGAVMLALNDLNQVYIPPTVISPNEAELKRQLSKALDPVVDPRNSEG